MIIRTLTGLVILAIGCVWFLFSHIPIVLHLGPILLGLMAIFEIARISKNGKPIFRYVTLLILALLLVVPIPQYEYVMLAALPITLILFIFIMINKEQIREINSALATVVSIGVVLLFKSVITLREWDNGFYYLTFAVTACLVSDVAALLFGRALGKHKLCPEISPKKTVEGAIGGLSCAVTIVLIAAILLQKFAGLRFDMITLAVWAILVSVIGQFGDLCMSVLKRIAGVKDFSTMLPGHGGILDRFDSHIFGIAFTLVFCALGGEFIY